MIDLLGQNIQKLRESIGLNQREFSDRIGISKQCLSKWENGRGVPTPEMLVRLANIFKISVDTLLGRENRNTIDVTGLTDEQYAHIQWLVNELVEGNKNKTISRSTKS